MVSTSIQQSYRFFATLMKRNSILELCHEYTRLDNHIRVVSHNHKAHNLTFVWILQGVAYAIVAFPLPVPWVSQSTINQKCGTSRCVLYDHPQFYIQLVYTDTLPFTLAHIKNLFEPKRVTIYIFLPFMSLTFLCGHYNKYRNYDFWLILPMNVWENDTQK